MRSITWSSSNHDWLRFAKKPAQPGGASKNGDPRHLARHPLPIHRPAPLFQQDWLRFAERARPNQGPPRKQRSASPGETPAADPLPETSHRDQDWLRFAERARPNQGTPRKTVDLRYLARHLPPIHCPKPPHPNQDLGSFRRKACSTRGHLKKGGLRHLARHLPPIHCPKPPHPNQDWLRFAERARPNQGPARKTAICVTWRDTRRRFIARTPLFQQDWLRFVERARPNQGAPHKTAICVTSRGTHRRSIARNLPHPNQDWLRFAERSRPNQGTPRRTAICVTSRGTCPRSIARPPIPTGLGSFRRKSSSQPRGTSQKGDLRHLARHLPPIHCPEPPHPNQDLGSFRKKGPPPPSHTSKKSDLRCLARHPPAIDHLATHLDQDWVRFVKQVCPQPRAPHKNRGSVTPSPGASGKT